ncbi:MAG: hypothetical protein M1812_005696 [Candelaria pacifica]|nr:MAG: hypothetical protein M1812_005696 [Candelaria pacifica]
MLQDLTQEIRRIVLSPYPVSLKKLHDITSRIDDSTILYWAEGHPCQVDPLASAVLEALQLWPFALSILQRLSLIVDFRNAILSQQPLLLDDLLKKAIDPLNDTEQYLLPCVALLSAPLPHDMPYPASMPGFFLRAVEHAAQTPSATTIRPIYALLAGSCNGLLTILPSQTVARFQEQLIKVLKNLEDHSVNLLCLATFATIIKSQKESSLPTSEASSWISSPESGPSAENQPRFEPIRQFFTPKKAPKILNLVVLRVVYACSGSGNLTSAEALESVKLAKEIVDAVEPNLRDAWLQSNAALTRKMNEKVLKSSIAPDLRLQALDFISSLLAGNCIPPEIACLFQGMFIENCGKAHEIFSLDRLSITAKLKLFAAIDEAGVTHVLRIALNVAARQDLPSITFLAHLKATERLIRGLTGAIEKSSKIRQNILCAVASNELSAPLKCFLETCIPDFKGTCPDYSICPAACAGAHRQLCLAISTLLIKTALYSSADNIGIEVSLAVSLLERQQAFAAPVILCSVRCLDRSDHAVGVLQLVEQVSNASTQRRSHRWRERLGLDLSKEAASRNEIILQTVGEVCRDLEDRCETVEQPLKFEMTRVEELALRNRELEAEAAERGHFLSGLEVEKSRLEGHVQTAEAHANEILQRCQDLETQALQAYRDIEEITTSGRDEVKRLELEHIASTSCQDDLLDEQRDEIKRLIQETVDISADLELVKTSSNRKDTEIYELQAAEKTLKAELATLSLNLDMNIKAAESMEAKHIEAKDSIRRELETIMKHHELKLAEAAEQTTRTQLSHRSELHELEQQRQNTAKRNDMKRQRYDFKVCALEETVAELRLEIRHKTKEFMEVQELSRQLVALMGHDTTSGSQHQNKSGGKEPFVSSTSSQSGSTPKRSKTRKTPMKPSMNYSKVGEGTKTSNSPGGKSTRDSRIPLRDLALEPSHQSPNPINCVPGGMAANCKAIPDCIVGNENLVEEDAMETDHPSFSDSDLLTSTQKFSLEQHTREVFQDETTVDL